MSNRGLKKNCEILKPEKKCKNQKTKNVKAIKSLRAIKLLEKYEQLMLRFKLKSKKIIIQANSQTPFVDVMNEQTRDLWPGHSKRWWVSENINASDAFKGGQDSNRKKNPDWETKKVFHFDFRTTSFYLRFVKTQVLTWIPQFLCNFFMTFRHLIEAFLHVARGRNSSRPQASSIQRS